MALSDYAGAADSAAAKYNVPPSIFRALIQKESGWNAQASNPDSSAYGLTQLTDAAAQDAGVTDKTDPQQQLEGGAAYLAQMYSKFGNWRDALSAYNQGAGNVDSAEGKSYADSILSAAGYDPAASGSSGSGQSSGFFSGITDWLSKRIGDIGLVVLGIAVVIVALAMSDTIRSAAKKAAPAA